MNENDVTFTAHVPSVKEGDFIRLNGVLFRATGTPDATTLTLRPTPWWVKLAFRIYGRWTAIKEAVWTQKQNTTPRR